MAFSMFDLGSSWLNNNETSEDWTVFPTTPRSIDDGRQQQYGLGQETVPSDSPSSSSENGVSSRAAAIITKIERKTEELSAAGLDAADLDKLKSRLVLLCREDGLDQRRNVTAVTAWRTTAARRAYARLQDANDHLILPLMLSVSPTECATPAFKEVLAIVLSSPNFATIKLNLNSESEKMLQSVSVDGKLQSTPRFQRLMEALFPNEQPEPQLEDSVEVVSPDVDAWPIQDMYSSIPPQRLGALLQFLIPGANTSNRLQTELSSGAATTECATIMIPKDGKDCICHFVVSRDIAMQAIGKFDLTGVAAI